MFNKPRLVYYNSDGFFKWQQCKKLIQLLELLLVSNDFIGACTKVEIESGITLAFPECSALCRIE